MIDERRLARSEASVHSQENATKGNNGFAKLSNKYVTKLVLAVAIVWQASRRPQAPSPPVIVARQACPGVPELKGRKTAGFQRLLPARSHGRGSKADQDDQRLGVDGQVERRASQTGRIDGCADRRTVAWRNEVVVRRTGREPLLEGREDQIAALKHAA